MSIRHTRGLLAATLLLILVPSAVLGHAELDTASPADKSTVTGSPPELVFTFTEAVDPRQPPGKYPVRWTTASAVDGDIAHGTPTFTIVAATPSPSLAASPSAAASE